MATRSKDQLQADTKKIQALHKQFDAAVQAGNHEKAMGLVAQAAQIAKGDPAAFTAAETADERADA